MTHILVLFIYYFTNFFCTRKPAYNRVSIAIVISWRRKRKQFHRSEWFRFLFCRIVYH